MWSGCTPKKRRAGRLGIGAASASCQLPSAFLESQPHWAGAITEKCPSALASGPMWRSPVHQAHCSSKAADPEPSQTFTAAGALSVWPAGPQHPSHPTSARILLLGPDGWATTAARWSHSPPLVLPCPPGEPQQPGDDPHRPAPGRGRLGLGPVPMPHLE